MLLPKTLFFYLIRQHLLTLTFVLITIISCIFFSNIFDLLIRLKNVFIPGTQLIQLAILKIPYILNEILSLSILISSLIHFNSLAKKNELIIIFNNNISIWKMLQPSLILVGIIGILFLSIIQPLAAYSLTQQENIEQKLTNPKTSSNITLANTGIVISELYQNERRIILASNLSLEKKQLSNVTILIFDCENNLVKRIDADSAFLDNANFLIEEGKVLKDTRQQTNLSNFSLSTSLTISDILNKFTNPENISFWRLNEFSKKLAASGLKVDKFYSYYYKLLFRPLYGLVNVLVAGCFINTLYRNKNSATIISFGIITGFIIHSSNEILIALLNSRQLNYAIIQLLPALITSAISILLIIHKFER